MTNEQKARRDKAAHAERDKSDIINEDWTSFHVFKRGADWGIADATAECEAELSSAQQVIVTLTSVGLGAENTELKVEIARLKDQRDINGARFKKAETELFLQENKFIALKTKADLLAEALGFNSRSLEFILDKSIALETRMEMATRQIRNNGKALALYRETKDGSGE